MGRTEKRRACVTGQLEQGLCLQLAISEHLGKTRISALQKCTWPETVLGITDVALPNRPLVSSTFRCSALCRAARRARCPVAIVAKTDKLLPSGTYRSGDILAPRRSVLGHDGQGIERPSMTGYGCSWTLSCASSRFGESGSSREFRRSVGR